MVPEIDLERLKAEARDEGFAAGLKAAENSLAAQRIAMLSRIEDRLKEGSGAISVAIEQDLRAVAHVAFSMISECLPAFCQRHGTSEMTALLRSTLPTLASEPNLLITVAQDSVELAQNEVSLLAERVAGQVTVTAARDMLAGDVRLTWQDGMACRDVRRLRAHMLERLAEIGLLEPSGKDLVT